MRFFLVLICSVILVSCKKEETLEQKVETLIGNKKLKVGVAFLDFTSGKLETINGDSLFPLQSVFKFHVAAKVLDEVDQGNLSLNQPVEIDKAELEKEMYSPMKLELGVKTQKVRLDSLMYYMVAHSDNIACDILLKQIGGASKVESYFETLNIVPTQIEANEEEMHKDWLTQYKNVSSPKAVLESLKRFYLREYLSGDSHNFLYAMMSNSYTGKKRIKAGLPEGFTIAHKTGTSGRNAQGMSSATNDAAIVVSKEGKAYVLVIFVTDSFETDETNEKLIADITKTLLK